MEVLKEYSTVVGHKNQITAPISTDITADGVDESRTDWR